MESAKIPTSQGAGKIKGIIIYKPLKRIPVITKILVTTANICWIMEKAREFQKSIYFFFIDYAKAFDCVDHNKLWKILKEMGIPDHLIYLLRNLYTSQEVTVKLDMEQHARSK